MLRRSAVISRVLLAAAALTVASVAAPPGATAERGAVSLADLGPNVNVFDPSMPTSQIQAAVDAVSAQQVDNEMGTERYALLFKPGTYGTAASPLIFQVGYYTEVAGLGRIPADVVINGSVDVYNRCVTQADNCIALDNFWRSLSNLTINVAAARPAAGTTADSGRCRRPRRCAGCNVNGNLTLMDYCTAGPQFASGGFIADSEDRRRHQRIAAAVPGARQQHRHLVERRVEPGVRRRRRARPPPVRTPTTAARTPPCRPTRPAARSPTSTSTRRRTTACSCPRRATDSSGTTWANGATPGTFDPAVRLLPRHARRDSVATINSQLARGKNLILTRGLRRRPEHHGQPRRHRRARAGHRHPHRRRTVRSPLSIADVKGVDIAGIMIDAGTVNSPALLQIGNRARPAAGQAAPTRPTRPRCAGRVLPDRRPARRQGHARASW